jgi:hypothetical protein
MWRIIVLNGKERDVTSFKNEKEADDFYAKVQEDFVNDKLVEIYKVSAKTPIPVNLEIVKPKQKKVDKNHPLLWCPYCGNWRNFKLDSNANLACRVCGISTNDFYVKKYNHLWGSLKG